MSEHEHSVNGPAESDLTYYYFTCWCGVRGRIPMRPKHPDLARIIWDDERSTEFFDNYRTRQNKRSSMMITQKFGVIPLEETKGDPEILVRQKTPVRKIRKVDDGE